LGELSREECMDLLRGASIGRVGVSIDALPVVLPVLIAVLDESVVFQTVPGTKLLAASTGAVVAVEVDAFDDETAAGWSVLVRGIASEIRDPARAAEARSRLRRTWIVEGSAEHLVEVGADLVTGRRLH
jgi:nitroimidazol reductase NimA-like FMN-containing flavoprotein (pyridoxamine 5'-phosphate oxidase superfamily)